MKNKYIKKGDKVVVISGNDRGTVGTVIARAEDKILVKDVNVRKRHMKSREQGTNRRSEIVAIERPIHISNVAIASSGGKKIKLKSKKSDGGKKELVYFEEGKENHYRTLRKEKAKG